MNQWKDGEGRTLFQIAAELSIPQRKALTLAARRNGGFVCPLPSGIHAAAAEALLSALRRKALITDDACPRITEAGRHAIAS